MNLHIFPSEPIGTVTVPPSKSMAHRFLICAASAKGKSVIENVDFSEDIAATCRCLQSLGVEICVEESRVTVVGCGGRFHPSGILDCGESGSTLRFLIPLSLLCGGGAFTGSSRLMERPLSVYEEVFASRSVHMLQTEGSLSVTGTLSSGEFALRGDVSSQFWTGLLFALPLLDRDSRLVCTTPMESVSYLDLTLSALEEFGISVQRTADGFRIPGGQQYFPRNVTVEGDESNAAFFGALKALGNDVTLSGRNPKTLQGDRVWESLFAALKGGDCEISVEDCPDLAPILMTVAALCHGATLTHTRRLRIKESDRGRVMAEELAKFGASVTVEEDEIRVNAVPLHSPAVPLCGHNDHRVVMSLAVMATRLGGEVRGAEAIRKSYPSFFEVLRDLRVRMVEV